LTIPITPSSGSANFVAHVRQKTGFSRGFGKLAATWRLVIKVAGSSRLVSSRLGTWRGRPALLRDRKAVASDFLMKPVLKL
jgi:hypothetical protein